MRRGAAYFLLALLTIYRFALAAPAATPASAGARSCAIVPAVPSPPQGAQVFSNTDLEDASGAIQEALDHLKPGQWLVFAPGLYRIAKNLIVAVPGVTLYGNQATLLFTRANFGGITVRGDNVSIYDLTLDQLSGKRESTPWGGGISVFDQEDNGVRRVRGAIIRGNVIKSSAAVGIFIFNAEDFTVAKNTVWGSLADGIHVTAGSANGRIIGNMVSQTGDDMIGVVSYAGSSKAATAAERYQDWNAVEHDLNKNIYIADNKLSEQNWGRGISVVGGTAITIERNAISRCPVAAGIYLVRESVYRTNGVHNIVVRDNRISDIQTEPPTVPHDSDPPHLTGHGAIEVGSMMDPDEMADPKFKEAFSVADVVISGNHIENSHFAGIRVGVDAPASVSHLWVRGNTQSKVNSKAVIEAHQGLVGQTLECASNQVNGVSWPSRCTQDIAPVTYTTPAAVNGAALRCSSSGVLGQ